MCMRISSLFVDFSLTMCQFSSTHHELGGLVWEDVEGQESFPVSAGFELTTQRLLVQEPNYSTSTHTQHLE